MSSSHKRVLKKKVRQIKNGKLNSEEVQHLRRCGLPILNKSKSPSKRPLRTFAAWWETTPVEKFLEDIVFLLKNAALLDIINLVAGVTIIISLGTWLATERQRRDAEVYQAWQVITAAHGQSGSGGRKEALEFLNSTPRRFPWFWLKWKRQSLAGLAAPNKAFLAEIDLQQADLWRADLREAFLSGANLQQAELWKAYLQQAILEGANLQQAELSEANLQQAYIFKANLQQAYLEGAIKLTPQQIKSACNWDKAIYKGNWNREKRLPEAIEPHNTNYIEKLKKDKKTDPTRKPDCSRWEK